VEKEFTDIRALLLTAASCQKPDQKTFEGLLNPLQTDIEAIARLKHPNRKDRDWVNHLTTVAEGAPCVGWVTVVSYWCLQKRLYLSIENLRGDLGTKACPVRGRYQAICGILWQQSHERIQGQVCAFLFCCDDALT